METLNCNRCGHTWYPRSPNLPQQCPKCRNKYWNKQRTYKVKEVLCKETNLPRKN